MFYEITSIVLVVAFVAVSVGALSLRHKLRAINVFGEKSTVRSANRDMLEYLADAAGLGRSWGTIEKIVVLEEQILRMTRLRAQPAEHVMRELQDRVRHLAAMDVLPEGWTRALTRALEGQLSHANADWTLKALTAWRDELHRELRNAVAALKAQLESSCA